MFNGIVRVVCGEEILKAGPGGRYRAELFVLDPDKILIRSSATAVSHNHPVT